MRLGAKRERGPEAPIAKKKTTTNKPVTHFIMCRMRAVHPGLLAKVTPTGLVVAVVVVERD